jgi:hypothetical protein
MQRKSTSPSATIKQSINVGVPSSGKGVSHAIAT